MEGGGGAPWKLQVQVNVWLAMSLILEIALRSSPDVLATPALPGKSFARLTQSETGG